MEIVINRGKKCGKRYLTISVDGVDHKLFKASRLLTGTTAESGDGIFNPNQSTIVLGEESKVFEFPTNLNLYEDPAKQLITTIRSRVKMVKAWTETIDFDEEIIFEI